MSIFNLNLIRTLDVLLETRNLTRTAEKLGITQSAVSRHLTQLRDIFQDPLLLREGQQYILTLRAMELSLTLKKTIESIENLAAPTIFDPNYCSRHFEIYGSDYLAEYMFPDILDKIISQAPKVTISFSLWQNNAFSVLSQNGVDLVATIADDIPENVYGCSLGGDYPVCIMSKNHPICDRENISLDDYLKWPHIRITTASDKDGFVDKYLFNLNMKRNVVISVPSFMSALKIIERTPFLLTMPVHMAMKFEKMLCVSYRKMSFIDFNYNYWLLWHGRVNNDPAHRWFRGNVFDTMYSSIHGALFNSV